VTSRRGHRGSGRIDETRGTSRSGPRRAGRQLVTVALFEDAPIEDALINHPCLEESEAAA
jgi:hypothetical protein